MVTPLVPWSGGGHNPLKYRREFRLDLFDLRRPITKLLRQSLQFLPPLRWKRRSRRKCVGRAFCEDVLRRRSGPLIVELAQHVKQHNIEARRARGPRGADPCSRGAFARLVREC